MRFFDARFDAAPLFAEAQVRPAVFQHLLGPLTSDWDIMAGSESLSTPIYLAHGRYDYTVPYRLWENVADALPDATFRLFERSGHQPFFEEPEEFSEALLAWMSASR